MPQISRETVEQILTATDIVDLISSYIPVRRAGTRFQALCPFHNEKTPSFSIDPVKQFFHCFGCKKSGDAISFVREYEGLPFGDAVRKLGERAGIAVVEQALDPKEEADRRRRGALLDLHRKLTAYYHDLLLRAPEAQHARDYLKGRDFTRETAERWKIGWAPPKEMFISWAKNEGLRGRDLAEAGILKKTERGSTYFYFRNRLMFPIANDYGDVIGFSGRQLEENPREGKYVNTPETRLFKKSNVLFGLDKARKGILDEKSVLICEGQIDAIVCQERGIPNAIAPLGTAFPEPHARTLRRYTKTAILCYDSDTAGNKAAESAFKALAGEGLAVKVVAMPKGDDPDSFIRRHGIDAFRGLLEKAGSFIDFKFELAAATTNLGDPIEKARFIEGCADHLAVIKDDVSREALVQHLATRLRIGAPDVQAAVARAKKAARFPQRRSYGDPQAEKPEVVPPAPLDRRIGTLCSLALGSAAVRDWLGEQFETLHELADHLDGVPILQAILTGRPDPESPASVNTFLAGLPEEQQLALRAEPSFSDPLPEDPVAAAELTLADASALALEKEDAEIKAALGAPNLALAEQLALLKRAKEIEELMRGMSGRALTNDRFAPNARRPKRWDPRDSKDFRDKRKP
ncbi:DNA primase [Haloferula sargassicola]|uniref:DNA primase n=1 Tax=Haloferula sargassicola TaxID=490096 RepID=A0ABP9UJK5_9BACT